MCIATAEPAERVSAVLAPLRPLLDSSSEVVIAVDDRVSGAELDTFGAVADRVLRFAYADPPTRIQPWLFTQCEGDWVLRLDADEVPSPALAAELRETMEARRFTHAFVPRRWISPGGDGYLAEWPWLPDYQLRLLRRDPAVVSLAGALHAYAHAVGAHRYLESPLYHLDLALNSLQERRAKTERYKDANSVPRIAGREFNAAYYLPEDRTSVRTAVIPDADAEAVGQVMRPPRLAPARPAHVESAPPEEVSACWVAAPFAPEDYAASLQLLEPDLTVYPGEVRTIDVHVRNTSSRAWPWGLDATPAIRLAHVWTNERGERAEGLRTPLPFPLRPGEGCRVPVMVASPPAPGSWTLSIDLVNEHVRWFGCAVQAEIRCG